MLTFDIETDGFLDQMTKIHCLVIIDRNTGEVSRHNDQQVGRPSIEEGVRRLEAESMAGNIIGGQNVLDFDIPGIQKIYPWFLPNMNNVRDSLVEAKLIWPDIKERDFKFIKKYRNKEFPAKYIGRHSLGAWGARLGCPKDDYSDRMKAQGLDPWAEWNIDMEDYCEQDVHTNNKLFDLIDKKQYSPLALMVEHAFQRIILRQEAYGFMFDTGAAAELYAQLADRRQQLTEELKEVFKPFYKKDGKENRSPKRSMKRWVSNSRGSKTRKVKIKPGDDEYIAGAKTVTHTGWYEEITEAAEFCKVKLTEFNPGSGQHIAMRLQAQYGWKPKKFTESGEVQVDEAVLKHLKYPPMPLILEYLLINKRIGQLAEGNKAWLKLEKNGRLYGSVNTMGAVTSRCTHHDPNMAQVPAGKSPYGKECRALFVADTANGKVLVGFDADALELRCLAGYMAKYDDGEYVQVVLNGSKEEGTDIHTRNMQAIGLKDRDGAKVWFYAFIYGAGDYKLGSIMADSLKVKANKQQRVALGKRSRADFQKNLPALGTLVKKVRKAVKKGWVKGLDGRRVPLRSEHAALNTLLQSAGAILMKHFLVIADTELQKRGYVPGIDYEHCGNIHDEVQTEVRKEIAHEVGEIYKASLRQAGELFNFRCPITGNYEIGNNWSCTH